MINNNGNLSGFQLPNNNNLVDHCVNPMLSPSISSSSASSISSMSSFSSSSQSISPISERKLLNAVDEKSIKLSPVTNHKTFVRQCCRNNNSNDLSYPIKSKESSNSINHRKFELDSNRLNNYLSQINSKTKYSGNRNTINPDIVNGNMNTRNNNNMVTNQHGYAIKNNLNEMINDTKKVSSTLQSNNGEMINDAEMKTNGKLKLDKKESGNYSINNIIALILYFWPRIT